jgi:O-antigen/teichoic acid export membrane protein
MSQFKKGAILSYINIGLSNTIGLILTPFIIKSLGTSEYGLYTLIGSFVAYLTLMDLGLNNTVVRYVAKYRAEFDLEGEKKFLATTMWVYMVISLILVLLGTGLYFQLDNIFSNSLTVEELDKAKIMFLILLLNLVITIPGGSFTAICNAYENFVFPRFISIVKYIMRSISIFAILSWGGKAISLVIIDTVLNILIVIAAFVFVITKIKIRINLIKYDPKMVREIFSYSFWVFLFAIVHQFQWNAGQVVLGITTSTTFVAIFGVGILIGGYYNAAAGVITSMLVPKATQLIVQEKTGLEITNVFIKVGRMVSYILFLVLSGFFLLGKPFINLWLGTNYEESWIIALLMMVGMTMPILQIFGNTVLEAKKKNRFKAVISLITVSIAVFAGYYFSQSYGLIGVIVPLVCAMILNSIIMNLYFIKIFNFEINLFIKKVLAKPLLVFIPLTIISYAVLQMVNVDTWLLFGLFGLTYAVIFFSLTYFLLMNNYERLFIKTIFK